MPFTMILASFLLFLARNCTGFGRVGSQIWYSQKLFYSEKKKLPS